MGNHEDCCTRLTLEPTNAMKWFTDRSCIVLINAVHVRCERVDDHEFMATCGHNLNQTINIVILGEL